MAPRYVPRVWIECHTQKGKCREHEPDPGRYREECASFILPEPPEDKGCTADKSNNNKEREHLQKKLLAEERGTAEEDQGDYQDGNDPIASESRFVAHDHLFMNIEI
jgi:hypothetical protein